jgi:hypothetical protein
VDMHFVQDTTQPTRRPTGFPGRMSESCERRSRTEDDPSGKYSAKGSSSHPKPWVSGSPNLLAPSNLGII